MRNLRVILISTIMVLALALCLAGCVSGGANALNNESQNDDGDVAMSYVVSFVTGTDQVIDPIEVRVLEENAVPTPNSAYKQGYDFAGWYLSSDFSGTKLTFPYTFTRNTTLYAKWIAKSVIKISTAEDLQRVNTNLSADYALVANIDLSQFDHYAFADEHTLDPDDFDSPEQMQEKADELKVKYANSWIPIAGEVGKEFSGTFDGNGYTISGMEVILTNYDEDPEFNYLPVGLFGKVTGTVKNVTLVDYRIQVDGDVSRFYIGGVAGWAYQSNVTNCSAVGNIINLEIDYTGNMWDSLFGSYAEPTESTYFGGVVGLIEEARVVGISSEGRITSESNADNVYLGGAVGYILSGSLANSNSISYVRGRYAGGLVGYNNGAISNSFAMGDVEGSLSYPAISGGLVSYNFTAGTIDKCYATGKTNARTAGGLVGVNVFDYATAAGGTIKNAYASGDVFASEYAGGLVGRATADLPIFGREDFHESIYNKEDDYGTSNNRFAIIENCLSYGHVEANVTETTFKDYKGEEVTTNVYYSVFAGSLIGQSYEQLIKGCVAFGDVVAISNRPITDDEELVYNSAFADNFMGHSTNTVVGADYRTVYAVQDMSVTRNGSTYSGFNSAPSQTYKMLNDSAFYRVTLGFDINVWNLNNLDVENGVMPTLFI
ncbi:MAG: InlB B-repeat-containing protein [Clostridia bacterium]|nr:InlB B-repeat-containing protein [Clostridia bacterium]